MTTKKATPQVLRRLLSVLLQEWGRETVRACFDELAADGAVAGDHENSSPKIKQPKDYQRPTAISLADRIELPESRKMAIRTLALRFDEKTFLPSVADVRNFMEMRGQPAHQLKQRQDSFRRVLDVLLTLPNEDLRMLEDMSIHAGPTRLGPLSDAISATGAVVRANADESSDGGKGGASASDGIVDGRP